MSAMDLPRAGRTLLCRAALLVALAILGTTTQPHPALAESPFAGLSGNWRGSAQIKLASGSSETLKCQAYYTPKESGNELGIAIRCASASNKIELRAQITAAAGNVSGTWEERTYNVAGDVTGQAVDGKLNLAINGGAFQGSMAVRTTGGSQTVNIKTEGVALQAVNINLSRG